VRDICLSCFFVWFQWFLLVFQEATLKNVKTEQGFRLCFYQETWDTNQGFQVPVTAGVPVWCGAVCCDVVSGDDDESMCLGSITRSGPSLVQSRSWYGLVRPRSVCMYVLETSEGPAVSGWVLLRWLQELKFKKEKTPTTSRTCVSNKWNQHQ